MNRNEVETLRARAGCAALLERQNLSFIERSMFAQRLLDLGYDKPTIQSALAIDAPMLTRMLSVSSSGAAVGEASENSRIVIFLKSASSSVSLARISWASSSISSLSRDGFLVFVVMGHLVQDSSGKIFLDRFGILEPLSCDCFQVFKIIVGKVSTFVFCKAGEVT